MRTWQGCSQVVEGHGWTMDFSSSENSSQRTRRRRLLCHGCVKMWTLRLLLFYLLTFCCGPGCCLASILDQLRYDVPEESSPQTLVGNITKDAHFDTVFGESVLRSLEFSLLSVVNMEYFTISNPFGILRTSAVIDRDAICATSARCVVELKVRVQPVQYFRIIKVAVTVLDQNDNTPIFPEDSVSLSISETSLPGARFPLQLAEDADSDPFSIQRYRLESMSDVFGLRVTNTSGTPSDLSLVLNRRVDRERQDFYRMKVIAMDGGTPAKTGTMWVEVSILDTNDNNPTFDRVLYEVTVPEDAPVGSVAVRVHAFDPDEGLNGDIIYSLSEPTVPGQENYYIFWTINNRTGDIYVKSPLDYEEQKVFHLSVKAQDRGANSLPAYTKVTINIEDVNDHSPEITLNSLSPDGGAQVKENMRDGTFVAHVTVRDPDLGVNGEVHCSMASSRFRLQHPTDDHGTFYIVTNAVFDREFRSVYHVSLKCVDGGYPAKTSSLEIPVTIIDDNDHVPHFDKPSYTGSVAENNKVNAFLLKLNATDEDSGRNAAIKYKLLNPGDQSAVSLNTNTGEVRARFSFDYEKQSQYSFVVLAYDQGEPSYTATTTLYIEVNDTNDHPPKFLNKSYTFTVRENGPHELELGYIEAVDNDRPPFNDIIYHWNNDPNTNPFRIDPATGLITCTRSLDHEIKSVYHLVAMAENYGSARMNSTVPVMIKVIDVNDNGPVFQFPNMYNNTIQVPVGVTIGTLITQIKATDPDEGNAGKLSYSLLSGNDTFRINPRTGEIAMNVDIKRQEWTNLKIIVQVRDAGSPPRRETAELHIILVNTLSTAQAQGSSILSGYKLIILLVLVAFVILVVTIIAIMVRLRHREDHHHKHKATTSGGITAEYTNRMDPYIDTDDDSSDGGTRPNGHLGAMSLDRPKKEVKFVMDVGTVGESSTDNSPVMTWASRSEKVNSLDMRGQQAAEQTLLTATTINCTSGDSPTPTVTMTSSNPSDKLEPVWVAPWGFPRHVSMTSQGTSSHGHPHSSVSPLTQMDLEMHEMLHVLGKEDSETGSVTDSGRGPSEEGDSRPNPLENSLNHEDKGAKHQNAMSPMTDSASDLRNALQICSSRKGGPRGGGAGKGYCFHDHKAGGSCAGQCLLKPSRTLTGQFHPTSSRNMRRGFNLSSDSSDTTASSLSLPEATRTLGRFPGNHAACHGNVDKKKPPTVTFQDQQNHFGSTQSLERPAGKGPMAKFAYSVPSNPANSNGNAINGGPQRSPSRDPNPPERQYHPQHPQRQLHLPTSTFYSNHDRLGDSHNNNNGDSSPPSSCSETVIVKPPVCPLESNSSPDRTSSFKGNASRFPVKGILKKADEPIRRCINDNLSKYGPNRGWGRDRDTDVISEDGTETTLSGSYTLDVDEVIEEELPPPPSPPPDPKAGFSV